MNKLKTAVSALTIGFLLVMSIDYMAYAATGRSMILGKSNKANKVTTVIRTNSGPAMQFKVKNGTGAPIKVNSKGRIGKLNADMVDGKHASDLGVRTTVYDHNIALTGVAAMKFSLPAVQAGSYLATMDGWIYGPSGGSMICYLRVGASGDRLQQWFPAAAGNTFFPVSTAGVVIVQTTGDLIVSCSSSITGNWSDFNNFQVTLTPIDAVTDGTTGVAPRIRTPSALR